jgi:hypothetical protein
MTGVSGPLANPPCVENSRSQIKKYMEQAHTIIELICGHLEQQLHLDKGTLIKLQSFTEQSGTALRMLKYEPQVISKIP